jgi:hypothetical protein
MDLNIMRRFMRRRAGMTTTTKIAGEAMTDAVNDGQSERAAFEADYAMVWNAALKENGWGGGHTADDVKALREGNTYGEGRDYLNARWEGWQARALLASKPAVPQTLSDGAQYFACYLIDNCENEVIREESVQAWLGKMLAIPRYHPTAPAQSCGDAEQADEVRFGAVELILRDVCEDDPADPDLNDTVCINISDLKTIIERHIGTQSTIEWAVGRWNAEVSSRPLVNVHRRSLDDTWRQVIRHLGGDDATLLGPRHSELLAAAPLPRAAEQADEAVTGGAVDGGHVDALEWHWSNSDEGPMYACGTDDVTESLAHALYETGIATFGEDQTSIFLCRFRPLKIDWKHHAEWLLEHIDDTVIDHVAEDAVPTEKTDVDELSTALASIVKVDASVAYDQCEFAPGDEKYETALLRVRNDATRAKDSK